MNIRHGDITAKIQRGKFGEYHYKSPRWGYKKAYRYNIRVRLFLDGSDRPVKTLLFKAASIKSGRDEILDAIKKFSNTQECQVYRRRIERRGQRTIQRGNG